MRGGSLNQMMVFQGGHIGQGALSIVPFGPNTHYMLCDHCLREAGGGGSNPLTTLSLFNDLAAFTDLLIPHLAHLWPSDEGEWCIYAKILYSVRNSSNAASRNVSYFFHSSELP